MSNMHMDITLTQALGLPVADDVDSSPLVVDQVCLWWDDAEIEARFFHDDVLVFRCNLNYLQFVGMVTAAMVRPEERAKMFLDMMMTEPGSQLITADQVLPIYGEHPSAAEDDEREPILHDRCLTCNTRIFGEISKRGICLDCVPEVTA